MQCNIEESSTQSIAWLLVSTLFYLLDSIGSSDRITVNPIRSDRGYRIQKLDPIRIRYDPIRIRSDMIRSESDLIWSDPIRIRSESDMIRSDATLNAQYIWQSQLPTHFSLHTHIQLNFHNRIHYTQQKFVNANCIVSIVFKWLVSNAFITYNYRVRFSLSLTNN